MSVRRSVKAAQEKARAKGTFPKGVFQMDKPTGSILKWDRSEGATFAGIGDDSSVGSNKSSQSNRPGTTGNCTVMRKLACQNWAITFLHTSNPISFQNI